MAPRKLSVSSVSSRLTSSSRISPTTFSVPRNNPCLQKHHLSHKTTVPRLWKSQIMPIIRPNRGILHPLANQLWLPLWHLLSHRFKPQQLFKPQANRLVSWNLSQPRLSRKLCWLAKDLYLRWFKPSRTRILIRSQSVLPPSIRRSWRLRSVKNPFTHSPGNVIRSRVPVKEPSFFKIRGVSCGR